ncbi:MAG: amidohydrolase [Gammaproteobacteria bacterium]|nr:amidohydrolase [Gammaproteobacteria bacterium]
MGLLLTGCLAQGALAADAGGDPGADGRSGDVPLFNDVHFHLTNYVQRGITARRYFEIVGDRVGRVAMFGIPLQQKWDHFVSGDRAPDYYLLSDAALYYYSFVDAVIAMEYLSLDEAHRARVDPMITGFNPTDMYAADHIRRVLLTFPGVFSGVGEFSVHKEFVSAKVAGHTASLRNPALDRILEAVAEIGLVAILHCDIDRVREGERPAHYDDLLALLAAHPGASVIWAHTGLGRFVAPTDGHLVLLEAMLGDPSYDHVALDISWDEVARYVVGDDRSAAAWAALIARHPTRFLFGTDSVAPADWEGYARTYADYGPLWDRLDAATRERVERLNYERLFAAAVPEIRAWEHDRLAAPTR